MTKQEKEVRKIENGGSRTHQQSLDKYPCQKGRREAGERECRTQAARAKAIARLRRRGETEKERKAVEEAEADKKQLEKTVSGCTYLALGGGDILRGKLLRELVNIGVSDPKCQDYILNGGSVT